MLQFAIPKQRNKTFTLPLLKQFQFKQCRIL